MLKVWLHGVGRVPCLYRRCASLLQTVLGRNHPEFSSARQQDVHEFFQHFLGLVQRRVQAGVSPPCLVGRSSDSGARAGRRSRAAALARTAWSSTSCSTCRRATSARPRTKSGTQLRHTISLRSALTGADAADTRRRRERTHWRSRFRSRLPSTARTCRLSERPLPLLRRCTVALTVERVCAQEEAEERGSRHRSVREVPGEVRGVGDHPGLLLHSHQGQGCGARLHGDAGQC